MAMYMTRQIAMDASSDTKFHSELLTVVLRYTENDWGDLCEEDQTVNREAIKYGGRILGAYTTSKGKIYIITDDTKAEPKITTVLYANEY